MKQKRKLGMKLLSFLLTLAMLVGLMPGTGLTAYAQELSGIVMINDVSVGDIIGTNVRDIICDGYTITLLANRHGDRNGNVKTTDTVLGDNFRLETFDGLCIFSGMDFYYPYDQYGICEAFEVTEIDHNNRTATLAGFSSPDNSVLLNSAIEYCYYNGSSYLSGTTPAESTYQVSADSKKWTDGRWYVVTDDVTIENRISINGTVRLVLCDGVTLNAPNGISLKSGNSLIIYGQTNGSGILNANNNAMAAGIGSENEGTCGNLTINSGTVNATGGYLAAGIGGGNYGSSGTVTINGGIVNATGGSYTGDVLPAGIGGGYGGGHGVLNIGEGVVLKGSDNNDEWIDITDSSIRKYYMRAAIGDTQTITVSDVTATYGDNNKKIEATTDGNGAISYAVKDGSTDYIDVASDGKLTIKKVPSDGKAYVTVTAAATDTYAQATKDVTVTINTKTMTVNAEDVNLTVDGQSHGITVNVTDPASGATVKYGTEEGSYTLDASPTQTEVGTQTVYYQVTADNYTTYTGSATVTVSDKGTQTINASDVTVTYGDTDKKVEATTDGNGAISYAVKDGSTDYIDVDTSTGALTIKKVGTATVVVTAAETDTYAQATKEVTVTINKANAVAATVTANNRTYDGTDKPLVNVAGEATGGEMKYALGTNATTAPDASAYTTDIPTKTNAGTYYVWYKAVGDDDHIDTTPAAVTVTVGKADLDLSVSLEGWTYGAKANTPEVTGNTGKGTVTYIYKAKDADDKNYSDAVPTAAGTYTVKATVAETDNYNAGTATADFTISKEDGPSDKDESVVTKAPTAKTLTYTGSAQELVTAGTATGGEMQYALGTATEATQPYTTSIPSATNAGTYYVWYRVVGDGFESSAGCVTVVINEEEKLKPGDIVVSEGDLVSEPVAETKYITAEATVNGEKLNVTISENFVNAIAYTGKRIDAVAHLNMSFDKTPIVSRFKIVDGSSVKPEDLIKVSYVQKYNKRANAAKKSKPTVYARIKVSKDAKKALSREDYKSLKKLVKKLNRELKKNQCNYRINQRSVTACEVKVVAKHGADGKIKVKNGKISGVKKVIVSIDVKDPKTGEITKNTFKLSKKEYSISDPDPENGTVRLTGKRNFTGTVTVKVE